MNTYNDWEYLLQLANEDLNKIGYSILITEPEEGFYNCEIWNDGKLVEVYATNCYENELSELVTEVWHYINYIKIAPYREQVDNEDNDLKWQQNPEYGEYSDDDEW